MKVQRQNHPMLQQKSSSARKSQGCIASRQSEKPTLKSNMITLKYSRFLACCLRQSLQKLTSSELWEFLRFCKNMSEIVNVLILAGLSGGEHVFRPMRGTRMLHFCLVTLVLITKSTFSCTMLHQFCVFCIFLNMPKLRNFESLNFWYISRKPQNHQKLRTS